MAPDFAYFLEFGPHDGFGHTLPGLFLLDLPLGLVVLWLFHRYAKQPLASLLPISARQRLHIGPRTLPVQSFSQFALIAVSIVVGSATHIVWDAFTHGNSWIAHHWSILQAKAVLPLFGPRTYAEILQYFSSAFGIAVILLWCLHWYRNTEPIHLQRHDRSVAADRIAVAGAFLIAIVVALVRAVTSGLPNGIHGGQRFLTTAAVTAIPVFWFGVVFYGLIRARRRVSVHVT